MLSKYSLKRTDVFVFNADNPLPGKSCSLAVQHVKISYSADFRPGLRLESFVKKLKPTCFRKRLFIPDDKKIFRKQFKMFVVSHFYAIDINSVFRRVKNAGVVKLADTPDLGSGGFGRGGSSPFARTTFWLCRTFEMF